MGTTYNIKISKHVNELDSKALKNEIDNLLINVNKIFSTYLPTSEVSKFNKSSSEDWQQQSEVFIKLLTSSVLISNETGGAYDITVGPLVNLWGFGPKFTDDNIPSQASIDVTLQKVGSNKLVIDGEQNKLKKLRADTYLDFSSIAKGYGVDKLSELISSKGYTNFMVEVGGEIRVQGLNSDKEKWRIAVEKPDTTKRVIHKILGITDTALATSGDYRNYFDKNGRRYSHTINPITGWPVEHNLVSVTVLADTSMKADAWATALMVLGAEKGYDSAIKNGLSVLFIVKNDNTLEEVMTPDFKVFIKE
jgi:thiamine biosynthesis lipoprotein